MEALPIKYFNEAHLPGAVQIDYTEVLEKAPSLLTNKSKKIVVYCASSDCENSTKGRAGEQADLQEGQAHS